MIRVEHIADLVMDVGTPPEVGAGPAGCRRVIPILGGEARGPKSSGTARQFAMERLRRGERGGVGVKSDPIAVLGVSG